MKDIPRGRRAGSLRILFRCYSYLKPYWRLVVGACIAMAVGDAIVLANPQLIRIIVDKGIGGKDFRLLGLLVGALLAMTAVKGVSSFLQGRLLERSSQGVAYDLRNEIHAKLASLSFAYHDQAETGQLLSRSIQDVDRLRFVAGRATFRLLESVVMATSTAIVLVAMSPRLALLSIACIPFLALAALRYGSKQRRLSRQIQNQLAVLTARIEQNIRGVRIVKAFAQARAEIDRFEQENTRWFGLSFAAAKNQAVFGPLMTLITNIAIVVIVWYGGSSVISKALTLGQLVAFTAYIGQLAGPVRMLGMLVPAISQAVASGERVFEVLDARSEVVESPDAAPLEKVAGAVEFENVSFSYFNRYTVLRDVSFSVAPGQVVALLGATGSGKSTIVNLIPRFYDATSGRILIDGRDTRSLTLASLRNSIGMVLQETTLFAATVRENILFGMEGADEDQMIEASKLAQAHEFIAQMPQGYDTHVGEKGMTLSGGQKQRIAIARAILRNPPILILDDATSSVDAATERLIQLAMETLMKNRTTFVIAHRLSTIRSADLILVLEGGQIAARGSHDDLMNLSPLYADIYGRQSEAGKASEPAPPMPRGEEV